MGLLNVIVWMGQESSSIIMKAPYVCVGDGPRIRSLGPDYTMSLSPLFYMYAHATMSQKVQKPIPKSLLFLAYVCQDTF